MATLKGSTWVSVNLNLTPGEWYHITGTFGGTAIRCYLNGIETDTNHLSAIKSGNARLFIGQYGGGNIFNGVVDELKIYNRDLSVEEVRADYEAGFVELNSLSGTVISPDSVGIANVTLTTREGTEIITTQTDSTGHYAFADVSPGFYDITATKRSYWPDSDPVTVNAGETTTADIMLCMIYDFNTNSGPADANRRLSDDG